MWKQTGCIVLPLTPGHDPERAIRQGTLRCQSFIGPARSTRCPSRLPSSGCFPNHSPWALGVSVIFSSKRYCNRLREMATHTDHRWHDVFQAGGTTTPWSWSNLPEREHHWSFSFRPFQANSDAEILRHFMTSNNNLKHTDHLEVRTNTGNIFRLSATWVSGA
jgi:hypothetical protein